MKMTSNDKQEYITVEMFNDGLKEIKTEIIALNKRIDDVQTEINEMKQEIKDTRNELLTEIRLNQHDVAHLQASVYWGFAIIAFVVAFISLNPFRKEKTEHKPEMSERDLRAIMREEIKMAQNVAVVGK